MADNMQPVSNDMLSDNAPGAYISERFREPVSGAAPSSGGGNYVLSGIFAIVAFLLFLVMLGLLYSDYKELILA